MTTVKTGKLVNSDTDGKIVLKDIAGVSAQFFMQCLNSLSLIYT